MITEKMGINEGLDKSWLQIGGASIYMFSVVVSYLLDLSTDNFWEKVTQCEDSFPGADSPFWDKLLMIER